MSKLILKLNEAGFLNNQSSNEEVIDVTNTLGKPDYTITDITVMGDEDYYPTIQNILIDLDENHQLNESQDVSKGLSINILSETVNTKTGYSNSLFEFESNSGVITLSLVLSESDKYDHRGVFNVSLYTTKGEKIYESNTTKPKAEIKKILNELSNKYLVSTTLNEAVLLPDDEGKSVSDRPKLDANEFEDLMTCVRGVLDGTALTDDFDASLTLYVDRVGDRYKISMKQSKSTEAIITPERNVYLLNLTEVTNQDDTKELANPDKDNAKAPKELKSIDAKPEEIKESAEDIDRFWNQGFKPGDNLESRGAGTIEIIDLDKGADYIVVKRNSKYLPYVAAWAPEWIDGSLSWGQGHYFDTEEDARSFFEGKKFNEAEESKSFNKARFVFGVNNLADLQDKLAQQLTTKSLYDIVDEVKVSDEDYEKITSDFTSMTNLLDLIETPEDNDTLSVIKITSESGDRPILLVSTDLKYYGIDYSNLPTEASEDEI